MCDGIIVACEETLEARQLIVVTYDKPPRAGPRICVAQQLQHDLTRVRARRFLVRKLGALVVKKRSLAVLEVEVIARHGSPDLCTTTENGPYQRAGGKRRLSPGTCRGARFMMSPR